MTSELYYMPAREALDRFRTRDLSPVELMEAVIARAEAVQPMINAFTYTHYDAAMTQAREAEKRYARGVPAGRLDGLPVSVKDESFIAGMPTSNGSLSMQDFVATHTSPANARLLDAGAIIHARTATPEFSCAGVTWSRLWGITRNPWNTDFNPGGSSGGSGAALAAGMCTLATGSDIGGSIRIPASACGVVGLKPAYGRVPADPPFNLEFLSHEGPMARSISDTALLLEVMAGPHPGDIVSLRETLQLCAGPAGIEGLRLAYSPDLGLYPADPEVRRNTQAALDVLRGLGATVETVELDWKMEWIEAGLEYLLFNFGRYIAETALDTHADEMTSYARDFAEQARQTKPEALMRCYEAAGQMYATLGPLLETHSALICPTMGLPALSADFDPTAEAVFIDRREVDPFLGWALTLPFNMLSRCPVMSVPTGHSARGVPTGMQIVGRTYREADVFRIATAYEDAVSGWYRNPSMRPTL